MRYAFTFLGDISKILTINANIHFIITVLVREDFTPSTWMERRVAVMCFYTTGRKYTSE